MSEERDPVVDNVLVPIVNQLTKVVQGFNHNPPLAHLSKMLSKPFSLPFSGAPPFRPVERKSEPRIRTESVDPKPVLEEKHEPVFERERVTKPQGFHRRRDRDEPALF